MTGNTLGWVIVAFVLYLLMMIAIGAFYAKGNNNSEDYFLGGRKLNGFVAALSAQASDMSGWLLMGLPGAIYLTGVGGDGWIAIGLFIGTTLNWLLIATKLRRYTIRANNSVTLPTYFENRFHDEKKVLMTVSSITIVVFFLVYCASALSAGGQLFESVFGIDYHVALTIGALVVLVYTFLGGFTAVCVTDFIQGYRCISNLFHRKLLQAVQKCHRLGSGMGFYVSSNHIDATLLSLMSRLKHGIGLSDTCGITEKDFEFSAFLSGCIVTDRTKKLIRILSWQFHFNPPICHSSKSDSIFQYYSNT